MSLIRAGRSSICGVALSWESMSLRADSAFWRSPSMAARSAGFVATPEAIW